MGDAIWISVLILTIGGCNIIKHKNKHDACAKMSKTIEEYIFR